MPRRRKKYKRARIPKVKRIYKPNLQDDNMICYEGYLQKIHSQIAKEYFPNVKLKGDTILQTEGMNFFFDPIFGNQAEIIGTSDFPLKVRLELHIKLFQLLRNNCTVLKAVKLCILTLLKQSKNLMNLNN